MTDNQASLRVAETDPKFVGRGIALVDQRIIADLELKTNDVVEISGNRRKTHALLWSGQQSESGKALIRIDGYTRSNLGIGIDDLTTTVHVSYVCCQIFLPHHQS